MLCRSAVSCLILGLSIQLPLVASDPPVTLETSTALELCGSCPAPQLRYLVVPKNGVSVNTAENPEVELVSLGPLVREAYRKAVTARWMSDAGKLPRAIEIGVDSGLLHIAGLYDVYLNLQPNSTPDAARLHLQFNKPAPKAAAIPKLIVERICYFPGASCKSNDLPRLTIQETTGRSPLTELQFYKVNNTLAGSKAVGGELVFAPPPVTVPAGGVNSVPYSLAGDFGLGLATGSITANAQELETPALTVDFQVNTHYTRGYILLMILLGLGFSYVTKILLQQKIELEQARVDALKLADQIEADQARHRDQEFRDSYAGELRTLREAIDGADADAINKAKDKLDKAYSDALPKLATRRQDEQTALDGLLDITQNRWILPASLSHAVVHAKSCAEPIQQLLRVDDLVNAKAHRLKCQHTLANQLAHAALKWTGESGQTLDALTGATEGISTAVAPRLAIAAQQVRTLLAKFVPGEPLDTTGRIQQALSDLQAARSAQSQFAEWLCSAIAVEVASAKTEIPDDLPADSFEVLDRQVESWCATVRSMVDEPDATQIPPALHGLQMAWETAIAGIVKPDGQTSKALAERRYLDAVKLAADQLSARHAAVARIEAPAAAGHLVPLWSLTPGAGGTFLGIRTPAQIDQLPPAVRPTLVTATKQLMKDKAWMTAGVAVTLTLVGYGLFRDSWVGTFADFSAAFFWAFGLDLTLDQVLKATRKP